MFAPKAGMGTFRFASTNRQFRGVIPGADTGFAELAASFGPGIVL
jgi:hypothetical protein